MITKAGRAGAGPKGGGDGGKVGVPRFAINQVGTQMAGNYKPIKANLPTGCKGFSMRDNMKRKVQWKSHIYYIFVVVIQVRKMIQEPNFNLLKHFSNWISETCCRSGFISSASMT